MMKIYAIILFILLCSSNVIGQQKSWDMVKLMEDAMDHHPNYNQLQKADSILNIQRKILYSRWFPNLQFNSYATYQSEVPSVDFPPQIPFDLSVGPPKDQYEAAVDIQQIIYEGGKIKAQFGLQEIQKSINKQQIRASLEGVAYKVSELCFLSHLLDKRDSILLSRKRAIESRLNMAQSGVESGINTLSNVNKLKAELLLIQQESLELESSRMVCNNNLSLLLPFTIGNDDKIVIPDPSYSKEFSFADRAEMQVYNLRVDQIRLNEKSLSKDRWPDLFGTAHLGYGNPGFLFLQDKWTSYFKVGAGIRWTIFDGFKTSKQKALLKIQGNSIRDEQESFELSQELELNRIREEIIKYQKLLKSDNELLVILNQIASNSATQLDAGSITATTYIIDLEAWTAAMAKKHCMKFC